MSADGCGPTVRVPFRTGLAANRVSTRTLASANLLLMLVVTTNDLPGWEIQRLCGEVFGLTVRSRNAFAQMGAGFKSMFGGELQGMTKNLAESRNEAMARLITEARNRGGNAIVAMRFDTTELGDVWTEICAYGTAVQAVPVTDAAKYTAQQLGYGSG